MARTPLPQSVDERPFCHRSVNPALSLAPSNVKGLMESLPFGRLGSFGGRSYLPFSPPARRILRNIRTENEGFADMRDFPNETADLTENGHHAQREGVVADLPATWTSRKYRETKSWNVNELRCPRLWTLIFQELRQEGAEMERARLARPAKEKARLELRSW